MSRRSSPAPGGSPRPKVFTKQNLRYHAAFLPAVCFCLAAGWFELTRAREGHTIAWVYVFEWPLFAAAGTYLWWRLRHDDLTTEPDLDPAAMDDPDDADLRAWRAYVDRLESDDDSTGGRAGA